jgi:hypothetical protein
MNQEELAYFQMEGRAKEVEVDSEMYSLLTPSRYDYDQNKTDTYEDYDA